MKVHLDRKLALVTSVETDNHDWFVRELAGTGVGKHRDHSPFTWGCYFHGASAEVIDSLDLRPQQSGKDEPLSDELASKGSHAIRVSLVPGMGPGRRERHQAPSYSMLGTDRKIENFELEIVPASAEHDLGCTCWGMVAYSDRDDGDLDDLVTFTLAVSSSEYARYEAKLSRGWANSVTFAVSMMSGLYSASSLDVHPQNIKVLAASASDQPIAGSEGADIIPNRLGKVGTATLSVNSRLSLQT